jgi:hypothetical protein
LIVSRISYLQKTRMELDKRTKMIAVTSLRHCQGNMLRPESSNPAQAQYAFSFACASHARRRTSYRRPSRSDSVLLPRRGRGRRVPQLLLVFASLQFPQFKRFPSIRGFCAWRAWFSGISHSCAGWWGWILMGLVGRYGHCIALRCACARGLAGLTVVKAGLDLG